MLESADSPGRGANRRESLSLNGTPAVAAGPARSARPRRLLVLAPFPPRRDARHGGARVMAELLLRLCDVHDVALVCLRGPTELGTEDVVADRVSVHEVAHGCPWPQGRFRARVRAYAGLVRGRPTWVTKLHAPTFAARVHQLVESWRPDVVQIEYSVMAQYLSGVDGCPAVLVEYDPAIDAAVDAVARNRSGRKGLRARLELRAWRRVVPAVLERVNGVAVFSEHDAAAIRRIDPRSRVFVVPLGVRIPERALTGTQVEPLRLIFVGSFIHEPNLDAALRLVNGIFPRIRAAHPKAALDIVGHSPPSELTQLARDGVAVHGDVPDVTPYVERAAVVVAPLRMGGGVRVKVLEALAAGKAVVASPLALKGIDVPRGSHVLVGETDDDLAGAVSTLLTDHERRVEMGERARAWTREHLSWERSAQALDAVYASVLRDAQPA